MQMPVETSRDHTCELRRQGVRPERGPSLPQSIQVQNIFKHHILLATAADL